MNYTRRDWMRVSGGALGAMPLAAAMRGEAAQAPQQPPAESPAVIADRARRMAWWYQARFGMFIHWGLYSVVGRHEWVMENEGIPVKEYEQLADRFHPEPQAARAWARLARLAGQQYMVMTTKHHEGFCNFDTKLTTYCAPRRGPGRDLVREYVDAARAEGLRVGFYYSLMDWHHPDGARCSTDPAARRRFVDYTHGLIRELMTNYGKIDVLWYDVNWPLTAEQWESERMNAMVFQLQPDIIVNNRNGMPGDFSTPEQNITAAPDGRAWETCMTMNDSWGYQATDDAWKSPKQIIRNLVACARGNGNYLLNIGPRGDGSVPPPSIDILNQVGAWVARNGDTVRATDVCQPGRSQWAGFTRQGNTLFVHVYFWPSSQSESAQSGIAAGIGGLRTKVLNARVRRTGQALDFVQDDFRVLFRNLPPEPMDDPVTVLELECDGVPTQDMLNVRENRPRDTV